MPPKRAIISGTQFGRLTVLAEAGRKHGKVLWLVSCDCSPRTFDVTGSDLRNGAAQSCGCSRREPRPNDGSTQRVRAAARAATWQRWFEGRASRPLRWARLACHRARARAFRRGLEHSIVPEDLLPLPTHCPVLGIPLRLDGGRRGSWDANWPSVDRIDNSKGYIQGNVWVISNRANSLKHDASLEELEMLVQALRHQKELRDA